MSKKHHFGIKYSARGPICDVNYCVLPATLSYG